MTVLVNTSNTGGVLCCCLNCKTLALHFTVVPRQFSFFVPPQDPQVVDVTILPFLFTVVLTVQSASF